MNMGKVEEIYSNNMQNMDFDTMYMCEIFIKFDTMKTPEGTHYKVNKIAYIVCPCVEELDDLEIYSHFAHAIQFQGKEQHVNTYVEAQEELYHCYANGETFHSAVYLITDYIFVQRVFGRGRNLYFECKNNLEHQNAFISEELIQQNPDYQVLWYDITRKYICDNIDPFEIVFLYNNDDDLKSRVEPSQPKETKISKEIYDESSVCVNLIEIRE
jgi:hypothetical protein